MPKLPTIAIDLDEVLAPFIPDLLEWYNQTFQTDLQLHDFISYNFAEVWGGTIEQAIAINDHFHRSRNVKEITLIPGVREALQQLQQHYRLVIVTSRPLTHAAYTHEWLDHHLPNTFADVILCNHWTTSSPAIKKSTACQQIGAEYLIDDLPEYVVDAAECGITGLLFGNYPWNQTVIEHAKVQRVNGWNDVINYLQISSRVKP